MSTLVLHHLEVSRSHRILWLLEELGLPYEMKLWKRNRGPRADKGLREVHPLGKAPVLEIDGIPHAESGHIIHTVLDRFGEGRLVPGGEAELRRFQYFLHYAEGSLMPPLIVALITGRMASQPFPIRLLTGPVARQIDKQYTNGELTAHRAYLESELADRDWFAGDTFSAADIQMSDGVVGLQMGDAPSLPRLADWTERIKARPAYQRAIEKGGAAIGARF